MKHMPYEETVIGDLRCDAPSEDEPEQIRHGSSNEEPDHTSKSAESGDKDDERPSPRGAPGKTPNKAEG